MARTSFTLTLAAATALAGGGVAAYAHDLTATSVMGQGNFGPSPIHAQGFSAPEAALVPDGWDRAIVSNTNGGEPGFLSLLNFDGTIENLHWVDGLGSPTGMRAFENTLYVANGTEIASVDMDAAALTGAVACPDAGFINDIATGPDGAVYGSETFAGGIYTIAPGGDTCEWFIEGGDPLLQTINGLYGADDALMVVTIPGNVLSIDYGTKEITVLGEGVGSLDGIEPFDDDSWLLSDTRGKLVHFHDGEAQVLNDTSSGGIGANDMAFDPETGTALLTRLAFGMVSLYTVTDAE